MTENWIRADEAEDVAGSIRHVIRTVQFVSEDLQAWKWIAIALHSALQGACVCHLTTTAAPLGAVTKRNAVEWLAYLEDSRAHPNAKPPETYLMSLPDLLRAVRKPYSAGDRSNAAGVTIRDSELSWLQCFHKDVRNQFTHFKPMNWSIEVSGIPDISKLIARIIGEILRHGWAFRHQDFVQRNEMERNLEALAKIDSPA